MVEQTTTMSKTLDSILAAPPLQRITPAARDAIASVEALAAQQSNAPAAAAQFEPLSAAVEPFSFSFSLDPAAGELAVTSPHALHTEVVRLGVQIKTTFHF
jgi:hypothetical protein